MAMMTTLLHGSLRSRSSTFQVGGSAGIASLYWRACSTFIECSSTSDNDAQSSERLGADKRATDPRTGGGGGQPTQGPVVAEGNRPENR